jgi:acyl carrier protein
MTQDEIKNYLSEQICDTMYMEREDLDDNALFSDFGLESTSLIKIIAKVNQKYSCNIEVKELLTYQSLNSATGFIFNKLNKN